MPGEKSHAATPKRREKAREDGDIAQSRELTSAAAMLAGVVALSALLRAWPGQWSSAYRSILALGLPANWEPEAVAGTLMSLRVRMVTLAIPVLWAMMASVAMALATAMAQTGGVNLRFEALQPKFTKLNPATNIKHIFSAQALMRLLKSLVPAAVLLGVAWHRMLEEKKIPPFSKMRIPQMAADLESLLLWAAASLFVWAGLDYAVERWRWEERLKMSRQELKDESKDSDGSPQIKGRIRNLQRQMRRRKLRGDVAKAAVVVTNPTHYAVALEFDFETMDAPRVLAKGRDLLAAAIREDARWAGVPLVENPPLARSLYKLVEPGETIPAELYAAVASILAWIYRTRMEQEQRDRKRASEQSRAWAGWNGRAGEQRQSPATGVTDADASVGPTLRAMNRTLPSNHKSGDGSQPGRGNNRTDRPGEREP
jgi:flagellar biosynthetic protein FlhB